MSGFFCEFFAGTCLWTLLPGTAGLTDGPSHGALPDKLAMPPSRRMGRRIIDKI
jgi:hypothetical protein